jgi:hypothetical protein
MAVESAMLEQSTKIFRSLPRHTFLRGSSNEVAPVV